MLEAVIVRCARACCCFPWVVIITAVIGTVGGVAYVRQNFAIDTNTSQLISSALPWRQRELQLDAAFPQRADAIVVVVDGLTPEIADSAARTLAAALAKRADLLQSVSRPDGGAFFERNGLMFLSVKELERAAEHVIRAQPFLGTLAADPTLRGFAGALGFIPVGMKAGRLKTDEFLKPLSGIADTLEALAAKRKVTLSWGELMMGEAPRRRDLRRFINVKPVLDYGSLEPGAAASGTIRDTARALGLVPEKGVMVRLTGAVPLADEEFSTLADGALVNSALTVGAVLLILWLALRSVRLMAAVVISLLVGLAITAALGLAMVGSLNLISVAFAMLFVGIGVDFGIQFAVRYRHERYENDDLPAALVSAAKGAGKPLALAAAATAAGFFAFLPTDYKGVSELGLIAGTGMIIAFLTSITLLPALLAVLRPAGEPRSIGYCALAPVDRFAARHRRVILALSWGVVIAGLPLLKDLRFDFNPLNLRSPKVESVATLLDLMKDPATAPDTIDILSPSIAAAAGLARRMEQLPEVSHAVTIQSFVPDSQADKLAIIADVAALLGPTLAPVEMKPAATDGETIEALSETAKAFAEISDEDEKFAPLALRLSAALMALARAERAVRVHAENALMSGFKIRLEQLRGLLQAQPVSINSLPSDLVRDWVAEDGRARVEVAPKGDRRDNESLRRFTAAVLEVAPDAIGTPILIQRSAETVVGAFVQAAALSVALIALILLIVLRRVTDVLLTLVPLLLASVVTLELMVLLGMSLNFANIIALPLLLGVGVAFKIYYVLAWRGGETSPLAAPLTRAVLFSALTTAAAFGSLWFSNHPGTSSMGKLLALSLLTTLAAAVLFQPILMGPPREKARGGG
ncbi:MAG TPA: MMPL family transporter [Hyphomicrobiaceae bacterium]|nr:MMPL family transporter [Hyphomicrobiaceae bacterium]